jgi:hypothetical protein
MIHRFNELGSKYWTYRNFRIKFIIILFLVWNAFYAILFDRRIQNSRKYSGMLRLDQIYWSPVVMYLTVKSAVNNHLVAIRGAETIGRPWRVYRTPMGGLGWCIESRAGTMETWTTGNRVDIILKLIICWS